MPKIRGLICIHGAVQPSSSSPANKYPLFLQFLAIYERSAIIQPCNKRYCTQNPLSDTMKSKQYTAVNVLLSAGKPGPGRDYLGPVFFSHSRLFVISLRFW